MELRNFEISDDHIGLIYADKYLDIHNCFDFKGATKNANTVELLWETGTGDWVKESIKGFKLIFHGVTFHKERTPDYIQYPEDGECLSDIGFLPLDMRDDFDSYLQDEFVTKEDDMIIIFQDGKSHKINCNCVDFVEIP